MKHKTLVIGLGDMGLPIAANLVKGEHEVAGFDLRQQRLDMLAEAGGTAAASVAEAAKVADTAFLMVMNGDQVRDVVLGEGGLLANMAEGSVIVVTATIKPSEMDAIVPHCEKAGVGLIDSPVSGGRAGAEGGTLTLMASGDPEVLDSRMGALESISGKIFRVGDAPGVGTRTKASLQAAIGTVFAAVFECLALSAKAGVRGEAMLDVLTNSAIASPIVNYCAQQVMDRNFKGTGSQMATIHKDVGISLDFARDMGVPMFTTAAAFQIFQSAMSAFPGEDNWAGVKVIEQITGAEVGR